MSHFYCFHQWNKTRSEKWHAFITETIHHEDFCEVFIESRSTIRVYIGKSNVGRFICVPDWRASCWVSDLQDLSYNKTKLSKVMKNIVDGTTVAYALLELAAILP